MRRNVLSIVVIAILAVTVLGSGCALTITVPDITGTRAPNKPPVFHNWSFTKSYLATYENGWIKPFAGTDRTESPYYEHQFANWQNRETFLVSTSPRGDEYVMDVLVFLNQQILTVRENYEGRFLFQADNWRNGSYVACLCMIRYGEYYHDGHGYSFPKPQVVREEMIFTYLISSDSGQDRVINPRGNEVLAKVYNTNKWERVGPQLTIYPMDNVGPEQWFEVIVHPLYGETVEGVWTQLDGGPILSVRYDLGHYVFSAPRHGTGHKRLLIGKGYRINLFDPTTGEIKSEPTTTDTMSIRLDWYSPDGL